MTLFRRLTFNLWYLRRPPWESGIVPPEVEGFIQTHTTGRALDLGCGSGTSSLALAKAGWDVTGVDFARRAIKIAERKAKRAGLAVDFRAANVTSLPPFPSPFDLILDIGCFHGLSEKQKGIYLDNLDTLLAPHGNWLLYSLFRPDNAFGPGLRETEIELISLHLRLANRKDGFDRRKRPSTWFLFQKP